MPFNLARVLKRAVQYNVPTPSKEDTPVAIVESPVVEVKIEHKNPMVYDEPKQEIEIPVYDPDIDYTPFAKKRLPNDRIKRKVELNPLSDE